MGAADPDRRRRDISLRRHSEVSLSGGEWGRKICADRDTVARSDGTVCRRGGDRMWHVDPGRIIDEARGDSAHHQHVGRDSHDEDPDPAGPRILGIQSSHSSVLRRLGNAS